MTVLGAAWMHADGTCTLVGDDEEGPFCWPDYHVCTANEVAHDLGYAVEWHGPGAAGVITEVGTPIPDEPPTIEIRNGQAWCPRCPYALASMAEGRVWVCTKCGFAGLRSGA